MRDFSGVAESLIPRRKKVHVAVVLFTIMMVPGIIATLEPIDIESVSYTHLTLPTKA